MVFPKLLSAIDQGVTVEVLTVIDSDTRKDLVGKMLLIYEDDQVEGDLEQALAAQVVKQIRTQDWDEPTIISLEDPAGGQVRIFWDRVVNQFRALVFGGGHISQPLVQILALSGFEVTVIDDRPEFANQARFPTAERVICQSFKLAIQDLPLDQDTAVIIVTRGHRYDIDCLRATMHQPVRYLGMIGSRRRIREIIELVREEGAPEDLESRLKAPIGLDLKAQTPSEIGVSIAAEVIAVYRGGSGRPLSQL